MVTEREEQLERSLLHKLNTELSPGSISVMVPVEGQGPPLREGVALSGMESQLGPQALSTYLVPPKVL